MLGEGERHPQEGTPDGAAECSVPRAARRSHPAVSARQLLRSFRLSLYTTERSPRTHSRLQNSLEPGTPGRLNMRARRLLLVLGALAAALCLTGEVGGDRAAQITPRWRAA